AHELRLPLSHIKGFVSSLLRTDVEWEEATWRDFLHEIDQEVERLDELIDGVLRDSAPHCAHLAFVDVATVVKGALQRIGSLSRDRSLKLDVAANLPWVGMQAGQMERVLTNLIQNAIKSSPPSSGIRVSARLTGEGELELTVEDEGPGIPAEDRGRIFEPFVRG